MKLMDILQEAEEQDMEVEVEPQEKGIEDPSYVFEINGAFDFRALERIMRTNEQGLTIDNYELTINTNGKIDDEAYENFIRKVEKLKFLNFKR